MNVTTTTPPPSDADAARLLAGALTPDENVLWAGRPDVRRTSRVDGRLVGLGLFWTAVAGAGFWGFTTTLLSAEYDGISTAARVVFLSVAAAPFVAVAAYCLGGHVWARRRRRARTAYAITTTRVLAATPALWFLGALRVRELARSSLGEVVVDAGRHDVGDVEFHDAGSASPPIAFQSVRGIEDVAALARVSEPARPTPA